MPIQTPIWSLPLWVAEYPFLPGMETSKNGDALVSIPQWEMTLPLSAFGASHRLSQPLVWDALARITHPQELAVEACLDSGEAHRVVTALPPWTYTSTCLLSLAALITPGDPLVDDLTALIHERLGGRSSSELPREIYETLSRTVAFQEQSPQVDQVQHTWWQLVSPPWRLLSRPPEVHATCLDLSLLFAGFLEALGEKPILLVEDDKAGHAWIAFWKDGGHRFRPLLSPEVLRAKQHDLVAVETTALCRQNGPLQFEEAVRLGMERLAQSPTVQGLDVIASRYPYGRLRPIQLGSEPVVQSIRWDASQEARSRGAAGREALHILYAFCRGEGVLFNQVFTPEERRKLHDLLDQVLPRDERASGPSRDTTNWSLCWESARSYARKRGDHVVQEGDLLWALLESPSKNVERVLVAVGCDPVKAAATLKGLWERPSEVTETRRLTPGTEDRP